MYTGLVAPDSAPLKYLLTYKMSWDQLELFFAVLGHEVGGVIIQHPANSLVSTNSYW